MYPPVIAASKYIRYWLTAANGKGHGTHSPFVYQFIRDVLNDKKHYVEYDKAEALRNRLLHDKEEISIEDMGAGSVASNKKIRTIASIAKHAAKPPKYAQLLFRIAKYYQPSRILELGSSMAISTTYLALAAPAAKIVTIEGASSLVVIARKNLDELEVTNCKVLEGNFDILLPALLKEQPQWDMIFIDGNHRKEATLRYFEWLLRSTGSTSIFIFDDIHWSREMEKAWAIIRTNPRIKCSIDLFFIGIVFFREEFHEKQDFTIRF